MSSRSRGGPGAHTYIRTFRAVATVLACVRSARTTEFLEELVHVFMIVRRFYIWVEKAFLKTEILFLREAMLMVYDSNFKLRINATQTFYCLFSKF